MPATLPGPFETLSLETPSEHVLLLTLDRPERGNALNTQMGFDLRDLSPRSITTSAISAALSSPDGARRFSARAGI